MDCLGTLCCENGPPGHNVTMDYLMLWKKQGTIRHALLIVCTESNGVPTKYLGKVHFGENKRLSDTHG
eukprot:1148407-Pelagomonas_calceolata.AAC.1